MFSDLCQMIQQVTQNHKRIMNRMLETYGITYPQYLVLRSVFEQNEVLASDLITVLDSDKATLSGIIKRLFERGWLLKSVDANDKRKQILTLTYEGRDKMHAIGSLEDECEKMLSHSLNLNEQRNLEKLLNELIKNQSQYLEKRD